MATVGWRAFSDGLFRLFSARRKYPESARQKAPRILAFVPSGPDRVLLKSVSQETGWILTLAESPSEIVAKRQPGVATIVIYDRQQSPDNWRDTLSILSKSSPRPYIILLSPNSDANLWVELQRLGGSDILRTPVDRDNLMWAVKRAWLLLRNQQQVRSHQPSHP